MPAPIPYTPRWTPLFFGVLNGDEEVGEYCRLQPRDGDVVRLEQDTGISYSRLVESSDIAWRTRLVWLILRRMKDPRALEDYEAFLDTVDVQLLDPMSDAKEAPGEEGKVSDLAPPTGESPSSPS